MKYTAINAETYLHNHGLIEIVENKRALRSDERITKVHEEGLKGWGGATRVVELTSTMVGGFALALEYPAEEGS